MTSPAPIVPPPPPIPPEPASHRPIDDGPRYGVGLWLLVRPHR